MAMIEGIGDEVIQVFVTLIFVTIATLAWYTTNISNDGTLRTVFLLERRRAARPETNEANSTASAAAEEDSPPEAPDINQEIAETSPDQYFPVINRGDSASPSPSDVDEETRIVETMDASNRFREGDTQFVIVLNRNRVHSVRTETPQELADEGLSEEDLNEALGERINIKLKFANEDMRQVEGRLLETLGSFKRRNFRNEISSNKLIKLIFNGRVLQTDSSTLQDCGLFDNCVVHCLINTRNHAHAPGRIRRSFFVSALAEHPPNNQAHEWHLENYLFGILCCFLGAAWYLRYVYSHLYTVTATIGLILMTGIFTIIMYGMHFPDNTELNQQRTSNEQSPQ